MTLNYSPHTIFPAAPSPAGMPPDGGGFLSTSSFREKGLDWELLGAPKDCICSWRSERGGGAATRAGGDGAGCSYEPPPPPPPPTTPVYDDIVDLLPADPFGMGLAADTPTWTAAIAGWIEDLATTMADRFGYYEYGDYYPNVGDRFNYYMCNGAANAAAVAAAAWFSPHCVHDSVAGNPLGSSGSGISGQPQVNLSHGEEFVPGVLYVEEVEEELLRFGEQGEEEPSVGLQATEGCSTTGDGNTGSSVPHDALLFALAYLDIPDLLTVEGVCKTLCSAVRGDPLLWRHIHIGPPLSKRITDDILLRLTERAKGSLECLSLMECSQVTDSGLRHVLESNPRLRKLSVPACTRLSVGGLVDSLKMFKPLGVPGIQHLRVGGLYGIKKEHFEELNALLGLDQSQKLVARRPRFYHLRRASSCDDDSVIDIEACPRCQNVRVVYDCPVDSCQAEGSELCRACSICIARCNQCGRCIHNHEYEETFSLEWICLSCMNDSFSCQWIDGGKNSDVKTASGSASIVVTYVG